MYKKRRFDRGGSALLRVPVPLRRAPQRAIFNEFYSRNCSPALKNTTAPCTASNAPSSSNRRSRDDGLSGVEQRIAAPYAISSSEESSERVSSFKDETME